MRHGASRCLFLSTKYFWRHIMWLHHYSQRKYHECLIRILHQLCCVGLKLLTYLLFHGSRQERGTRQSNRQTCGYMVYALTAGPPGRLEVYFLALLSDIQPKLPWVKRQSLSCCFSQMIFSSHFIKASTAAGAWFYLMSPAYFIVLPKKQQSFRLLSYRKQAELSVTHQKSPFFPG